MARLDVRLLGPFRVAMDGEPVTGFASDKVRALLAYLCTEESGPHRREKLAGLLWPDWPEPAARANLRRDGVSGHFAGGFDHFGNAEALSVAEVVGAAALVKGAER